MTLTPFEAFLANHLWQSTMFALTAALVARGLRRHHARARYWVLWTASLKFLIPFSMLVNIGALFSWRVAPPEVSRPYDSQRAIEQVVQPFTTDISAAFAPDPVATAEASGIPWQGLAATVWFGGCAWMLLRWGSAWVKARSALQRSTTDQTMLSARGRELEMLRRLEQQMQTPKSLPVALSHGAIEPRVFGLVRPVLVWPDGLSDKLSDQELEAILVHELSHVIHRDNLTSAMHMVAQTIFWFHPLTWWLGNRLVDEREKACDEDVLRHGSASLLYAEGILKVCEFCLESPLVCASGVTGSNLKKRIENITGNRIAQRLGLVATSLLAVSAVTAVAGPIAFGVAQAKPLMASRLQVEQESKAESVLQTLVTPVSEAAVTAPITRAPVARPSAPPSQGPKEVPARFEAISIRPSSGLQGGGGRGGPGGPGQRGGGPAGPTPCGGLIQVNPGRLVGTNVTLHRMVALAYGMNCRLTVEQNLLSGLPDWSQSVAFDIQATMPEGSPAYTQPQLINGNAPQLQQMIKSMLAERFSLALHSVSKEIPVYNLVVGKMGRIKFSDDQNPPPPPSPPGPVPDQLLPPAPSGTFSIGVDPPAGKVTIRAASIPIATLIAFIQGGVGRMVVDKTELKGLYDIPEVTLDVGPFEIGPGAVTVWPEIMLQLGLRMEPTKGSVQALVVDRADRPTEN